MTEPFDLDARIKSILEALVEERFENVSYERSFPYDQDILLIKQLIRDTFEAVKPGRQTKSPGKYLQHHIGYASCLDELEANITNLLGDK